MESHSRKADRTLKIPIIHETKNIEGDVWKNFLESSKSAFSELVFIRTLYKKKHFVYIPNDFLSNIETLSIFNNITNYSLPCQWPRV